MREILEELDGWLEAGEEIALATLVGVRGSAPRLPGARLAVTRSGGMAGSVSGGCVENDVFERAMAVLDSGEPAIAEYGIADELGFEVGLSCGGTIEVLIEPFAAGEEWNAVREAVESQRPAALAVGLAPEPLMGRRLAIRGGESAGGIDAALDGELVAEADRLMLSGGARVVTLPFQGGEASVFVEAFPPQPRLLVVGATHVAMPLCRFAKELGFRVTVIDARSLFATKERFPEADELLNAWPEGAFAEAGLDAYSYVVVLTHDPKFDLPALELALRADTRYIGAMGNRATHERRKEHLGGQGFGEEDLARIHAPVGLDLGGRGPEEIALAIVAEMLAVRHGKEGQPLTGGSGAIHARR
jgi:xanthine dehydrogenase accessory factor